MDLYVLQKWVRLRNLMVLLLANGGSKMLQPHGQVLGWRLKKVRPS